MKTRIDFDECEGKTIEKIYYSWIEGGVLVTYTDKTYSYFIPYIGMEDKGIEDTEIERYAFSDADLLSAEIYTREELKAVREKEDMERIGEQKERDLLEYERLKNKLGL